MPGRTGRGASIGLSLTPLIDIVFLLLVFFMLTAHFVEERALDIQLPEARTGQARQTEEPLTVVLGPDGEVRVAGEAVAREHLGEALRSGLAGRPDRRVRIRGDARADLGAMVEVLDAARGAGARALDVATRSP